MTMLNSVIRAGADSVYFGIEKLNMRANAANFTLENLPGIAQLCHESRVEAQLTLNSIVMEDETGTLDEIVSGARDAGVDLIICHDPAVIQKCLKYQVPFCISTQASVSNSDSAQFYKNLGAKRIVLARECTLQEIISIKNTVDVEIETFIHGAMCVAVSGRCFMSHEIFGRSANQGDCVQPCRREYEIYDGKKDFSLLLGEDYVMSAKDLNTLPFIEQLIESGIDAFKIEGRKRSPEYASTVTRVYRNAVDAYYEGNLDDSLKVLLNNELEKVYNRGYSSGFYFGTPDGDDISKTAGNESPYTKEYAGRVLNYYPKAETVYIELEARVLEENNTVLFIGETTGVVECTAENILCEGEKITDADKGSKVTFKVPSLVRRGDKVYILKKKENPG